MYAVGDHLYGHIWQSVDTLYSARHLELVLFVDNGHGVVEVSGVHHARLMSGNDVSVCGASVADRSHDAMLAARLYELYRAR